MRTRSLNLLGVIYQTPAAATITINGVEVHQGAFVGEVKDPTVYEEQDILMSSTFTLDDSTSVWLPVVVTLQSGQIDLGMFSWNYDFVMVPGSDPEQWVQDADTFNFGIGAEECHCNRRNELINGEPVPEPGTDIPIMMHAGDVVTFETLIFHGPAQE